MATTPNFAIPYPLPSAPVKNGAADMQAIADRLDLVLPGFIPKTIVDAKGDLIVATGADAVARLARGTDGQVLTADAAQPAGVKWATPASGGGGASHELAYAQITADKSVTQGSEAVSDTVVAAPAVTVDGSTALVVTIGSPGVIPAAAAGATIYLILFQDGVSRGIMGAIVCPASAFFVMPVVAQRRFTPAAGSRQYTFAAYVTGGAGTIRAGAGSGAGIYGPAFIRIERA